MMTSSPFLTTKRLKFCDRVIVELALYADFAMNSARMGSLKLHLFVAQQLQATA